MGAATEDRRRLLLRVILRVLDDDLLGGLDWLLLSSALRRFLLIRSFRPTLADRALRLSLEANSAGMLITDSSSFLTSGLCTEDARRRAVSKEETTEAQSRSRFRPLLRPLDAEKVDMASLSAIRLGEP